MPDDVVVEVDVVASAQTAALFMRGDLPTPGAPENGTILSSMNLRIAGPRGVVELQFATGTSLASVAEAVNKVAARRVPAADIATTRRVLLAVIENLARDEAGVKSRRKK